MAANAFHYLGYAQEVIFSAGALAQLGPAVERFGWRRLMLCTTGSARRGGRVARIADALGDRLVATYDHVQPHVPDYQLSEALAIAVETEIDAIIGLGGGSPIGLAKAVSLALEEVRCGRPARAAFPTDQPLVPVIAIPTTYAGSEMTAVYGVTQHPAGGQPLKVTVSDPKIAPKLVIYDPTLTFDMPPELTASTGINALAHCIEALYSITRHPLSTAAALSGLRHIVSALPGCAARPNDLEARTEMLMGAHLAGASLASAVMGLHHGLCHVLGGAAGVPHGVANSIILPHAMRFNADAAVPPPPELAWGLQAAAALGLAPKEQRARAAADAAAEKVSRLVGQLNLPQRLRDAGVNEADLPRLAQLAYQSRTVHNNPKPITGPAPLEALLRAAW
jgi:alcohol dehydrogenase class IV